MAKQFKIADIKTEEERNPPGKTTVESVAIAMDNLFSSRWNLQKAAHFCGKSEEAMKFAFWEYLRRKPLVYTAKNNYEKPKPPERISTNISIN